MKNIATAILKAGIQYLMSKEATKLERALLAGVGVAIVTALRHAAGV